MSDGSTATIDIKDLFSKEDVTLENYTRFREAALATESNMRALEELAEKLEPTSAKNAVKKGVAFWLLGKAKPAIEALDKGHKHGDETATVLLGRILLGLDDSKTAKVKLKEGLAENKDSKPIKFLLILATLLVGELDDAEESIKKAISKFGESAETTFLKGFHSELSGDYEEAKKLYEKAIEQDPDHANALFRLGRWHATWGEEIKSVEYYERCREQEPTYTNALLNLGNLYEDRADYEKATECYRQVLRFMPSHSRARLFLKDAEASKTMFYDEDLERRADRRSMILKIPVTDFELSVRSRNCLNKMNVKTLGDLIQMTEAELLAHKNFGETSLMEVKQMLAQKGLRLGMGKMDVNALAMGPEQKQNIPEEVLKKPVADLELSVRSRKCMERLNIESLGDLIEKTEAELLAAKNFGQTSLNEIKQRLEEHGLRLKDAAY
jgi:DNA-directed RNA polymerase subunit alpha